MISKVLSIFHRFQDSGKDISIGSAAHKLCNSINKRRVSLLYKLMILFAVIKKHDLKCHVLCSFLKKSNLLACGLKELQEENISTLCCPYLTSGCTTQICHIPHNMYPSYCNMPPYRTNPESEIVLKM